MRTSWHAPAGYRVLGALALFNTSKESSGRGFRSGNSLGTAPELGLLAALEAAAGHQHPARSSLKSEVRWLGQEKKKAQSCRILSLLLAF